MKNNILNVTLKNDELKAHLKYQGTYEISDMVNGKPSWIFHENKRAIWYDRGNWNVGFLRNLGTETTKLYSNGTGDLDPANLPSTKWKYLGGYHLQ